MRSLTQSVLALLGVFAVVAGCGGGTEPTTETSAVPVARVTVTPSAVTLNPLDQQPLVVTAQAADGRVLQYQVTYESTEKRIATVSSNGLVSAVAAGTTTISVSVGGVTDNVTVTVRWTSAPLTFASVTAGGAHTCALTAAGAAWCWGRGESGQLGIAPPTTTCQTDGPVISCATLPGLVSGGFSFAQLAAGAAHTCGLTSDGTAYCWGSNTGGQLGDGTQVSRNAPVAVATTLKFTALDGGAEHTCGVTATGVAYCWGRNQRGQLGDGSVVDRTSPVAVSGDLLFRSISAGGFSGPGGHTCGVTTTGVAYCWGDNGSGQLGIGAANAIPHPTPVAVQGLPEMTSISAGLGQHTCALATSGVVYCWGLNDFGALGNGTTTSAAAPVVAGQGFARIAAGGFIGHTCALTTSGDAVCWGDNEVGQVGDATQKDRFVPTAVAGGLKFSSIDAGFRHSCGRTADGVVYCWGSGGAGQLGTNSNLFSAKPAKVVGQP